MENIWGLIIGAVISYFIFYAIIQSAVRSATKELNEERNAKLDKLIYLTEKLVQSSGNTVAVAELELRKIEEWKENELEAIKRKEFGILGGKKKKEAIQKVEEEYQSRRNKVIKK